MSMQLLQLPETDGPEPANRQAGSSGRFPDVPSLGHPPWRDSLIDAVGVFIFTQLILGLAIYVADLAIADRFKEIWHAMPENRFMDVWGRWDSGWYFSIVNDGYQLLQGQSSIAFFPLYPLLVDVLTPLTGNVPVAALMVSRLCLLLLSIVLHRLTMMEWGDRAAARRTVLYIAIFPTAFFFSAVYTESLFLLLAVSTFYFARRQLWAWAALTGMLASATRLVGIILWGVDRRNRYASSPRDVSNSETENCSRSSSRAFSTIPA